MTDPTKTILQKEAELVAAGVQLQEQGLELLLAEMRALAALMTGPEAPSAETEAEIQAKVEAGFDNMPV